MADSRDITGKNRKFKGTSGIVLPKGTQAERADTESGEIRFNTDTNLAEYYDGTDWKPIDAPPTITGFTVDGGASATSAEIGRVSGDATIVISGSNFDITSGTVVFEPESGGSNVTVQTITRTNSSSFTVTVTRTDFLTANDPYAIKLTNGSGLAATLASAITANDAPVFSTAADTTVKSSFEGQSAPFSETTLAATDAESDTITYSISAGALPPGVTINSATAALEGTISDSSIQNYTFTVQAATSKGNSTRQFVFAITASPYVEATGGTVLTSGDYKTHVFTSPGSFVVSNAGLPSGSTSVEYAVVAGGGSGTTRCGGGGGAGGYRQNYPNPATGGLPVSAQTYPITVGGGGTAQPPPGEERPGGDGSNSAFSTITSAGGGGGLGSASTAPGRTGNGGSGGGGSPQQNQIGTGNSPPVSPPQGNPGGPSGVNYNGAGGGGAGATGSAATPTQAGPGGVGSPLATTFFGPTSPSYGTPGPAPGRYFAGGGGGGSWPSTPSPGGTGGAGGGGNGRTANQSPGAGFPATSNTGGGGGGAGGGNADLGGSGGSGIVVLRYKFQ